MGWKRRRSRAETRRMEGTGGPPKRWEWRLETRRMLGGKRVCQDLVEITKNELNLHVIGDRFCGKTVDVGGGGVGFWRARMEKD